MGVKIFNGNTWQSLVADSALKLASARTINGVPFDGTTNITVTDSTKLPLTGGTVSGQLVLSSTTDISPTVDGALVIGTATGEHITFDANEIMAKNANAVSTLYLNNDGGLVQVGSGGLSSSGNINSTKTITASGGFVGNVTGNVSGSSSSCTGNSATATLAATVGTNDVFIQPGSSNEINFGGAATATDIYFGYRAVGSRPIPTTYRFGEGGNGATIIAATFQGNAISATTATTANKVSNNLILKVNTGTVEGTSLYTFNGSAAKTLDIKAGANITLSATAGVLTISSESTPITAGTGLAKSGNTLSLATYGTAGTSGPTANATLAFGGTFVIPSVTTDAYGRVTRAAYTMTMPANPNTNYYPTTFAWANGTAAGPTGSLTGTGMAAVVFPAIPSASTSNSGVVNTTTQTFVGVKTFNNDIIGKGSVTVGGSVILNYNTTTQCLEFNFA